MSASTVTVVEQVFQVSVTNNSAIVTALGIGGSLPPLGAEGSVLRIAGGAPAFGGLDGGTA